MEKHQSSLLKGREDEAANSQLERMGYNAELPRNLGLLSIFGL